MTAGRRDQLATALRDIVAKGSGFISPESNADALLPTVDAMIRQAQAEALESAGDDYDVIETWTAVSAWLYDRAAALRASTRGTDQPLGDETTPAGTSTARERDRLSSERNEGR